LHVVFATKDTGSTWARKHVRDRRLTLNPLQMWTIARFNKEGEKSKGFEEAFVNTHSFYVAKQREMGVYD